MKTDLILSLADRFDLLESDIINGKSPMGFDMHRWYDPGSEAHCGTACCVAGWISFWNGTSQTWYVSNLANHLEIPLDDANAMSLPSLGNGNIADYDWDKITPPAVAAMLRDYVETEKVDWEKAIKTVERRRELT